LPELYDHILSDQCYAVRLMLGLLGVNVTRKTVDYNPAHDPPSAGVLSLNPAGDLPVMVDGNLILTDVPAILVYLAQRHDPAGLWGAADAEVKRWLMFSAGPLSALHEARGVTLFSAAGDRDVLVAQSRAALRTIEDHLTDGMSIGREFMTHDRPSLADIAIFPHVMLSHDCGIGHEDYPAINLWQRSIRRLPGFVSMPGIPDYF
jgi:glutathione S-transferase